MVVTFVSWGQSRCLAFCCWPDECLSPILNNQSSYHSFVASCNSTKKTDVKPQSSVSSLGPGRCFAASFMSFCDHLSPWSQKWVSWRWCHQTCSVFPRWNSFPSLVTWGDTNVTCSGSILCGLGKGGGGAKLCNVLQNLAVDMGLMMRMVLVCHFAPGVLWSPNDKTTFCLVAKKKTPLHSCGHTAYSYSFVSLHTQSPYQEITSYKNIKSG